jgi:hypothetical protein
MKTAKQLLTTIIILFSLSGVAHSERYQLDEWKLYDAFEAITMNLKLDTYLNTYFNNTVFDAKRIGTIQVSDWLRVCYSRHACKCDVSTEVPEYGYFWVWTFRFSDVKDFAISAAEEYFRSPESEKLDFDTWFMLDVAFETYRKYLYVLQYYLDNGAWGNHPDFCYLLNSMDEIWGIELDLPIDIDAAIQYHYDWDRELLMIDLMLDGNVIENDEIDIRNCYLNEDMGPVSGKIDF